MMKTHWHPWSQPATWLAVASTVLILSPMNTPAAAPAFVPNYDESKVPPYVLPDPLRFEDGRNVRNARDWRRRRAEVLELFREHMYGHSPGRPRGQRFEVRNEEALALGGRAQRREIRVWLTGREDGPWVDVLLYVPSGATRPVPAFLGLNFEGNQAVTADPGVTLTPRWVPRRTGDRPHQATEETRGGQASRWAIETILERGYAFATIYCGDLEPDHPQGWREGVRSVFPVGRPGAAARASRSPVTPGPSDWGAIAAWAWGLSRALDALERDPAIDARRVAVFGHSRLGKTALWAGAEDERFAMVISNNSGEGGAALARRRFGETTWRINTSFPHWFNSRFKDYNNRADDLPIDQHQLIALLAPRPAYIASAEKDQWADPRGEFLSGLGAGPVYALLGRTGLGTEEMPDLNQPVGEHVGYHFRTGAHDVTLYDWERYLDFADRHWPRP